MPQAVPQGSIALGIRLNGGRFAYKPGDTITGWVVRGKYIFTSHSQITITIAGRIKTKVIVNRFKTKLLGSAMAYRGWTSLIDEKLHTQTVFSGEPYVPPGEMECAWPFAITIPTTYVEAEGALPRDLPGTFTMSKGTGLYQWDEAYVEYTLRAEFRPGDDFIPTKSVLSITVMATSPDPLVTQRPSIPHRMVGFVCSYRLHSKIGLSAPSGPSGTPEIVAIAGHPPPIHAGNVQLDTPTIIQLEHPEPVSLCLSYFPLRGISKTDADGKPYKPQLLSLTMAITSTTETDSDGPPPPRSLPSPATVLITAWPPPTLGSEAPPLFIPYGDDDPPIDVGKVAGLRIGYGGAMSEPLAQGDIRPSFSTQYIKSTHSIKYEMKTVVCEEEMNYSCVMDVTVLPPARTMAPPTAVAPPMVVASPEPLAPPLYVAPSVVVAAMVEDMAPQPPSVPKRHTAIPRPGAMRRQSLRNRELPARATIRSPRDNP